MKANVTKKSLLLGLMLAAGIGAKAQDIHFSQFYENSILRNPGLTGIFSGDYKAGVNYRTQWGNISNPFQTVIASAETRINISEETHDYLSFGLCTSYDQAGSIDFNSLQVTPAINYNKSLNDQRASYLSLGFAAGYIQRSINPSKMTTDDMYINGGFDPNAASGENMTSVQVKNFDVSAGLSFNSTIGDQGQVVYYIGASAFHITRPRQSFNPNESFIRLNPRFTGNVGIQARLTSNFGLVVHANYTNQQPYRETIFGAMLNWRGTVKEAQRVAVYAGCFMRMQDAIIPTVRLDYQTYSFTMSYDVTTSSLKPSLNSKGGWEFSIYARGRYNRKNNPLDQMHCPKFEEAMQSEFNAY
jgi:type IX secretion system PorP/SprF family membrane protein